MINIESHICGTPALKLKSVMTIKGLLRLSKRWRRNDMVKPVSCDVIQTGEMFVHITNFQGWEVPSSISWLLHSKIVLFIYNICAERRHNFQVDREEITLYYFTVMGHECFQKLDFIQKNGRRRWNSLKKFQQCHINSVKKNMRNIVSKLNLFYNYNILVWKWQWSIHRVKFG